MTKTLKTSDLKPHDLQQELAKPLICMTVLESKKQKVFEKGFILHCKRLSIKKALF